MRTLNASLLCLCLGSFLLMGCAEPQPETEDTVDTSTMVEEEPAPRMAEATLTPTEGNAASGTVMFTEMDDGLLVEATVTGLTEGLHGFHVHENGDCGDNGQAAGGHFAPGDDPHGAPTDPDSLRHVGDLGNLEAGAEGTATYSRVDPLAALEGPNSIVGKAVIVHADEDDLTSQPTGNAGGRVACGIVTLVGEGMDGSMMDGDMEEEGEMEDGGGDM